MCVFLKNKLLVKSTSKTVFVKRQHLPRPGTIELMRDSAPKINNGEKHTLFRTFKAANDELEIKAQLLKYDKMVFILKQNFGRNKVNFFHHLSSIGGNFYNLQGHFGTIQGLDEEVTSIVTPELSELLDVSTIASPVPLIEDYMKIKSTDDLKNLKTSENGLYYTARNFIPVPLFMLHELNIAVLEYDGDSKEVLVAAIKVIEEFDAHIDEIRDNQIEKAKDSCIEILHWLFLASKGKINSILTVACSVREVRRHFNIIQSSIGIEKNVLRTVGHSDIFFEKYPKIFGNHSRMLRFNARFFKQTESNSIKQQRKDFKFIREIV